MMPLDQEQMVSQRTAEYLLQTFCLDDDLAAAEELGLPNVWARSLPGRLVPATAAAAICDAVFYIIKERGDPE